MSRFLRVLVGMGLLLAVGGSAYWAGLQAIAPPAVSMEPHPSQTYVATTGIVGRTISTGVTVVWSPTHTATAAVGGVVTSVLQVPGEFAQNGDVLATIELRPVVAASGHVPMFRDLSTGVRGPDVTQFQELLRAGRFLREEPTGRFDAATVTATKRWQRAIGVAPDGVVRKGDIVFFPALPARLVVVADVGNLIAPGAELVSVLGTMPAFTTTVGGATRAELTTGMGMSITAPGGVGEWHATLGEFEPTEDGRYRVQLGGTLCNSDCGSIAVNGETDFVGRIVVVPDQMGVVVPESALRQTAAGTPSVALADGTTLDVQIVAAADGFAVVNGLVPGTQILLPTYPTGDGGQ